MKESMDRGGHNLEIMGSIIEGIPEEVHGRSMGENPLNLKVISEGIAKEDSLNILRESQKNPEGDL